MIILNISDLTHVRLEEIEKVKKLIEVLQMRQSLLSETTLVSDDSLCPICYAQQNGKLKLKRTLLIDNSHHFLLDAVFEPCHHQSCHSCIIQHLMSASLCFYCKSLIMKVKKIDGTVLYTNEEESVLAIDSIVSIGTQASADDAE